MTYAIIDTLTNKILKDAQGYAHTYSTEAQASDILTSMGAAGVGCEVRPV